MIPFPLIALTKDQKKTLLSRINSNHANTSPHIQELPPPPLNPPTQQATITLSDPLSSPPKTLQQTTHSPPTPITSSNKPSTTTDASKPVPQVSVSLLECLPPSIAVSDLWSDFCMRDKWRT